MSDNEDYYNDNGPDDFEDDEENDESEHSEGDDLVVNENDEKKEGSDDEDDENSKDEDELLSDVTTAEEMEINKKMGLKGLRESKEKLTVPILRKFEKAKLLSVRARQIDNGAKTQIPIRQLRKTDSLSIAKQELEMKIIPNRVVRKNNQLGTYEIWKITDFKFIDRD